MKLFAYRVLDPPPYCCTNHDNIHVRGYKEEDTITTSFDMTVLNEMHRFHLVMDTIDRLPQTGDQGIYLKQQLKGQAHRAQTVHRQVGLGHVGNPELEVEIKMNVVLQRVFLVPHGEPE